MARDEGTGSRRGKSIYRKETKARYQDVVRDAQKQVAQDYADDPVTGRIPARPGGTRHRDRTNTLTNQAFGYGFGAASLIPGPTRLPFSALSGLALSTDPATKSQFKSAKERVDAARKTGDRSEAAKAALDFALVTGAAGVGPGGGVPGKAASQGYRYSGPHGGVQSDAPTSSLRRSHPLEHHHEERLGRLMADMARRGQKYPVLVDEQGRVIDGHQRLEAAKRLGWKHIRVMKDDPLAGFNAGAGGGVPRPAGADEIVESLPKAERVYRQQEKLRSAERSKRVARASEAMEIGGEAGFQAAIRELKGELPKLRFGALEDFNQDAMEELLRHVQQHEGLQFFEKVRTRTALKRLVEEGSAPTPAQRKLLARAFGDDTAAQIADSVSFWKKAHDMGVSVLNVPRAMQSTLDFSAPFRQALVLGARHPRMFFSEFGPGLRALRKEGAYEELMEQIVSRPTFRLMEEAKLAITGLDEVANREDAFMSNLAETLTGGKRGPVRMSSRGYVGFLNKFRADAFDNYLRMAEDAGHDITDKRLLRDIASWVNHATGRGSIKGLEGAMPAMTTVLFSPRLVASRLQLLNPAYYARLHPFARKQALQGATQLLGAISLTLYLAKLAGAEVVMDPRNSDFGKIKVGNTRVDIAGGFQQYVVNAYRIIKKETVSSTTGEVQELEGGFGKPSRMDILGNFAGNKLAPGPQYARGWANNENFAGEPFDPAREAGKLFVPIGVQNAREGFQEGVGPGVASTALNTFGFGVLTYGSEPKKPRKRGGSSKSIYASRGGGGKSIYRP